MRNISASNCILIFPQLSRYALEGLNCVIEGTNRADYKLFEVISQEEEIPHVMKYDLNNKAWEIYNDEEARINIMRDVEFVYQYRSITQRSINHILSFLNLYSSAKIGTLRR